ncbi:hypothetical protein AGMMS50276_25190 [Synergistales bacterium]|nr:hypothetical protein AGMMS50276_25190 [Synergistales bacterium]
MRPVVVIDTNVIVSALKTRGGKPDKILCDFVAESLLLVYTAEILEEYIKVLYRPRLNIDSEDIDNIISVIELLGYLIDPEVSSIPFIDESDRKFYDAAKSAEAYLITGNIKHFPKDSFIVTPSNFLDFNF